MIHPCRQVDKDVGVSGLSSLGFQVGARLGGAEPAVGYRAHAVIELGVFQFDAVEHSNLFIVLLAPLLLARVFGQGGQGHGMRGQIARLPAARLGLLLFPIGGRRRGGQQGPGHITERAARAGDNPLLGPSGTAGLLAHQEITTEPGHYFRPLRLLLLLVALTVFLAAMTVLRCRARSASVITGSASGFTRWE